MVKFNVNTLNSLILTKTLQDEKNKLIQIANFGQDRLLARGGGVTDLTWYNIPEIKSFVINLHINTADAMGANIVNTICEKLSIELQKFFPDVEIGLRILTNLSENRWAEAKCKIPSSTFNTNGNKSGIFVVNKIEEASLFAEHDVYRASTHNKGIMNGVDPVLIATGNDWRAVEAGAHAYSCQSGQYKPLSSWHVDKTDNSLCGHLKMPLALGTVGGVTKLHPTAKLCLKILKNPNSKKLSEIICAVGLAQNLSALRALATEGIQKGHMNLHTQNKTYKEL